ncbi:MAG TPA: LptE family protein [Candidatus Acidoferrum sp.]|jgi:hypothetical protein|nr:LptE family protein [Candidatus Acidoferrum sp.]
MDAIPQFKSPTSKVRSLKAQGSRLNERGALPGAFRFRLWAPSLLLALTTLGVAGCAGYRLGPPNGLAAGGKSVQVSPFVNQTLQPRLTDAVTSQMRRELQRDGTYQLATHADGDIIITGALTRYQRLEVTFAPNDILTVRDYRLSLTAHVTARERSSGKLLLDQPVTGYTLIQVGSDLSSAERQAMPLLAQDLAQNVTALLAEGKW